MWAKLLQTSLTFVLEYLLKLLTRKWDEYQKDTTKNNEIKQKVKAIKDAKTKDELRIAVRDLSI